MRDFLKSEFMNVCYEQDNLWIMMVDIRQGRSSLVNKSRAAYRCGTQ